METKGVEYWTPEVIELFAKKFEYRSDLFMKYSGIQVEYNRHKSIKELLNKCFDEEHKYRPRVYYVDDKLIFVKKDLEECYPDIFGENCIDLYFHSLKVFPYVNDFDTININLMK